MRWLFSLVLILTCAQAASAAQSRDAVIDQTIATLMRVQTFSDVQISPDASRVAFARHAESNGHSRPAASIFVAPVSGGKAPVRISASTVAAKAGGKPATNVPDESSIAWSPDGREIAFVSTATGDPQLYVASADGRDVRALTKVRGELSLPRWSPDGRKIALLLIENASRRGGALEPMTPPSGDVEKQIEEQRIAIVDVTSKSLEFATPANMYVFDYDWSPDSASLVAEAVPGSGENNYWIAQLYRFDHGDTNGRVIYKPVLQLAWPRWSPDGKSVAFIEGLMSDQGSNGGDVMIVPAAGGAATNLTPGMHASAASLSWLPGSKTILAGIDVNGMSGFARVQAGGGGMEELWSGAEHVSVSRTISASIARDGVTTAAVRDSFDRPEEVWAGPIGTWKQITHDNDAIKPLWGSAENLNWNNEGFRIEGWLLYPRDLDRTKKYPMVVQVHGGPSSAALSSWPSLNLASLVACGYIVLLPNPRGSYGQGEAFTKANVKDFGYGDFRDIVSGVDAAVAKAPVDPKRVGVWGWSYGGYMTMWAVTQTDRFRAAVSGAGLSNWQSYYGENSIDQWMIPFFGASVYDDPWIYARSSPITFIKNVKTPTLVVVGDRDGEVPAPQSFEFWHALKTLGVKTQLVVYPNEGHAIRNPEHRRDIARRLVMWFDANM
jgi:dipeptidyl aminopeptidase/acylaminoacyl peptidase